MATIKVNKKIKEVSFDINKKNYKAALAMLIKNYNKLKNKFEMIDILNMTEDDENELSKSLKVISKTTNLILDQYDKLKEMSYEDAISFIKPFIALLFALDKIFIKFYSKYVDRTVLKKATEEELYGEEEDGSIEEVEEESEEPIIENLSLEKNVEYDFLFFEFEKKNKRF